MNARRRLLATTSAVGALLALTACALEKPAPLVTLVSGGESIHKEANTWCFEGQEPPGCAERAQGTKELSVRGGETVGVDVGDEVAERGWFIELSDPTAGPGAAPQRSEPQTGHYFAFTAPNLPSGTTLDLTVKALPEQELADPVAEPSGVWRFTLTPRR